jgi:hypothetical protein
MTLNDPDVWSYNLAYIDGSGLAVPVYIGVTKILTFEGIPETVTVVSVAPV